MIRTVQKTKVEYGDFQTPLELAERICHKLVELGVAPDVIIEPTCGVGNFIKASAHSFQSTSKIVGIEINPDYLQEFEKKSKIFHDERVETKLGNFFKLDWPSLLSQEKGKILVLGNFPWVTNSQQGTIDGDNLPDKTNFQKHEGLDAVTGKSNFDRQLNLSFCATYKIDTREYFNASVEACILICKFNGKSKNYLCNVFSSLEDSRCQHTKYINNVLVKDVLCFNKLKRLYNATFLTKWRSGIKHDCSNVMDFYKIGNNFKNGLGKAIALEETYFFPLIKGSDVAQGSQQKRLLER